MRNCDVKVGETYAAKVSGRFVCVRLVRESPYGLGWDATNLSTGRKICIRSAARLRWRVKNHLEVLPPPHIEEE